MDDYFQSVLKRREVQQAIDALASSYTDQDDVIDAMNFADEAIKTMWEAFTEATFDPRGAAENMVEEFDEGKWYLGVMKPKGDGTSDWQGQNLKLLGSGWPCFSRGWPS
jgi:hypothetical protein